MFTKKYYVLFSILLIFNNRCKAKDFVSENDKFKKAVKLIEQKKYKESIEYVKNIEPFSDLGLGIKYRILGKAYFYSKKFALAYKYLSLARDIDPKNYLHYNNLGYYYVGVYNFPEAIKMFTKAIELEPENYLGYAMLGKINITNHNYTQAEKYLKKSLIIKETFDALIDLAIIQGHLGKFSEVIDLMDKANEYNKMKYLIYYNYGVAYYYLKNYKKAEMYYKKSLLDNDKYMSTYMNLGSLYYDLKKYNLSMLYYKKFVSIYTGANQRVIKKALKKIEILKRKIKVKNEKK